MAVLLANTRLGVRRRIEGARDARGERTGHQWGNLLDLLEGRTKENADGTWGLGVDPSFWPVSQGDMVLSEDGSSWLVQTAALLTNSFDDTVDWVRITALHRGNGGTEPGGAWFVGRYTDRVEPVPPGEEPISPRAGLWTGNGPPPAYDFGARAGDEYIDLTSGVVYELRG